jgi:tetratricopeptide (TPR) repeat protein
MNKILKLIISIIISIFIATSVFSKDNFFDEALNLYEKKKYEEALFLFERNIVFNPKDANSYLYLAKIYNYEKDQRKAEYNLETALLIEPENEEVLLMLMKIALEKSNYSKVKIFSETFIKVCKKLCSENSEVQESLKSIEPKNES